MANENKSRMLRQIAEHYKITKNVDFARFFGIDPAASFQRIKNGYIDYEDVYNKCPDISPDWLLSGGEGPMLRADRDKEIAERLGPVGKNAPEETSKSLELALEALSKEQEMLACCQMQVSGLIDILKGKGDR